MCGFIGLISPHQADHELFTEAAQKVAVRGNAPHALRLDTHESYSYARLPTDDVTNQTLARISPGPSFLLFNGLVTNTTELSDAFQLSSAARNSDHKCLQEGFKRNGEAFFERCRGMFACAFVTNTSVVLTRDTIGIKPLYYIHDGMVFAFASEMKALQPFARPIHEVLPGGIVRFHKADGRIHVRRFRYTPNNTADEKLEALLYEATVVPTQRYLEQAPQKRVALLLSGGLDSSLLAQLLVNYLPVEHRKRLIAFSIGNQTSSDVAIAKRLAVHLQLTHVHVPLPDDQIMLERLKEVVYRTESPYARVSKVALLYNELASAIKKYGIDVVVGGEGADELFFGYHRFIENLTHHQSRILFEGFYKEIFPQTLLQRFDRIFAGHKIEGRVPFLDQAVVDFAFKLSAEDKVHYTHNNHVSKVPLRQLAKQLGLPEYAYLRGKEKMTAGATGKDNSGGSKGYLEEMAQKMYHKSFKELVCEYYAEHFSSVLRRASLATEEALAEEAELFKRINRTQQEIVYART